MAFFWIFNMGRSEACGDVPPYQQLWRWKGAGKVDWALGRDEDNWPCPGARDGWEAVPTSDPHGGEGGWPDGFVGVYGNWWGVTQSGGRWIGEHGIGPVDCPYIDALDEVAQDHDINCYLAVEAARMMILAVGDFLRIEGIWKGGMLVAKGYAIKSEFDAHLEAADRVGQLPEDLREKLKKAMENSPFFMRWIIVGQAGSGRGKLARGEWGAGWAGGVSPVAGWRTPGVVGQA